MQIDNITRQAERDETQLAEIRDLMVAASSRGAWLTLSEIARRTEFGEASISAQLRHLRKKRNGRYLVEKRPRRRVHPEVVAGIATCQGAVWEYRVFPPRKRGGRVSSRRRSAARGRLQDNVVLQDKDAPGGDASRESGRGTCQNA
jgi:hypothetical protein